MSKPVTYSVLIRDGQKRCFEDVWATLYRELFWGPEAFEAWLNQGPEAEYDPEELSGMVIVNFDTRQVRWGEQGVIDLPRVQAVHQRLLEKNWPGFTFTFHSESEMEAEVRRMIGNTQAESQHDEEAVNDDRSSSNRPATVRDAAGLSGDSEEKNDDEEEEDDDEADDDSDDMSRAWLTIIDQNGKVRHRILDQISSDLISGVKTAVQDLAKLKAAEVPPEKDVTEGLWINVNDRKIGMWGGPNTRRDFPRLQQAWPKWNVSWASNGYADQCAASGVPGIAMTDTEALAKFIPQILSIRRFDVSNIVGAVGGELRKTAMKATGCLLIVLAVPILLIGFFMDKLKEAGYTIAGIVIIAAIAFKLVESKVRSKFRKSPFVASDDTADTKPPVAGPLDEDERRRSVDRALSACGYPSLDELKPHFAKEPSLEDLM